MSFLEKIYQSSPVSLQTMMLNAKAFELYLERYGKKFNELYIEFESNEYSSSSYIIEYQENRLKALVDHAYNTVPYYKEKFDQIKLKPSDIKSLTDLHKIPVLTKEDIRSNFDKLISVIMPRWKLRHGHTSGTTGSPLNLIYDKQVCVVHHVADWRQKVWAGMEKGDAYASLQGRVICPISQKKAPFWRKNYINNQLFLSSFHLNKENLPYYFDKLAKDDIKFIEGYPSTIYTLASYLLSVGQVYKMTAVLTSSETLFDFQREAIENAFQCKVFDFYGMAERVIFAAECSNHGGHHINEDYGITEFLDDNNEPVQPGNIGHIVATSLHNFAFPLIRYKTNDSCSLKKETCDCGRVFPLMDDVATKNESIITLPDGRWLSPSVLTHPFKPMDNIIGSQIIQEDLHNIHIKIIKNMKYSSKDESMLLSAFKERIGENVNVYIEYVSEIEKTKNSKFKWVISKIPPKF